LVWESAAENQQGCRVRPPESRAAVLAGPMPGSSLPVGEHQRQDEQGDQAGLQADLVSQPLGRITKRRYVSRGWQWRLFPDRLRKEIDRAEVAGFRVYPMQAEAKQMWLMETIEKAQKPQNTSVREARKRPVADYLRLADDLPEKIGYPGKNRREMKSASDFERKITRSTRRSAQ